MDVGLHHFLVLSALLFAIGAFGLVARRNLLGVLMSAQVMLAAGMVALAGFSHFGYRGARPFSGDAFVLFVAVGGVAEIVVALALLLLVHRRRETLQADELDDLGG
jgi:NADH:ubiquinone oxidoreductase subunit K